MNALTVGPTHSGTGLNGSGRVLQPHTSAALPTRTGRRTCMLPSRRMACSIAKRPARVNSTAGARAAPCARAAAALWALAAASAAAHPEYAPTAVNRYAKLDLLAPDELRLAYTVMVGAAPAQAARQAADVNRDGRVDDGEARALG